MPEKQEQEREKVRAIIRINMNEVDPFVAMEIQEAIKLLCRGKVDADVETTTHPVLRRYR